MEQVCPVTGARLDPATDYSDRTLIISGASRGIGHATVKRFHDAGWRVITISRQSFDKACPWEHGEDNHVRIDLSDLVALAEGLAVLKHKLAGRPLTALVNNAGISPKGRDGERMGTVNTSLTQWQEVMTVNFFAPLLLARGLMRELRDGRGSIVNVTSIAGSRVHPFAGAAYATSKAALAALTREMANDFGPFGIRVNAIAPGEIDTAILSPGTEDLVEREIPMRRLGLPDEVASVIYALATDVGAYVSGAEIHINGGQHV
ncbi:MAG: SDR family oxidoreductase [Rhodospirillaceae bacterium]|nr:SDR family NAD(P)-dependent oxidoreductase [Rhodospirillaceae bacterium]MXY40737.1 SDR family oxidoreductase [Rhodospirillaceae bacterium]MYF09185.1 SDR family oxidoreductase [Rhodospirillaceae bacterium]MYH37346.1 SDR family oxidoreductase [Rhodospirillaceae bacterium]MYJ70809.1 SDR family oxidoreductase [Rhodospirillaceae bacterium]